MKNYWKQNKKLEIVSEQYLHGFLCVPGQSSVFISGRLKGVEFAALSTSIYWMPHGFCVYYLHKSQGLVVFSPFSKGETDLSTNLTKVTQPLSGRDRILKTKILLFLLYCKWLGDEEFLPSLKKCFLNIFEYMIKMKP